MSLKDIPKSFRIDSEEDLRFAVAQYFLDLGFELNEISFEDRFQIRLGHNVIVANKDLSNRDLNGRSDILVVRDGNPLAIVETKSPDHELTDDDAWQAISYARLLHQIAPYSIVTNGKETRVYDTVTSDLTPIENPTASKWALGGQQTLSISEDLRYATQMKLVDVNKETFQQFCEAQVKRALEDLKGDIRQHKKYIPDIYVPREGIREDFARWLQSDMTFFAVSGESGFGKTNFMCATAEESLETNFVLFYSAIRLQEDGIFEALRNDFVWEFHRERGIAYVVERLENLCNKGGKSLVIFVDGMDEFPGAIINLKNDLIEICDRMQGRRAIKFCISCKTFDWPEFVIENGQSYNRVARSTYPPRLAIHQPEANVRPDAREVGIQIQEFDENELENALELYRIHYSVRGEFRGDVLKECHNPLMLRFISEVYGGQDIELPYEITSRDLFDMYWDRKLNGIDQKIAAEAILSILSSLAVTAGERHVLLDSIRAEVQWNDAYDAALRDLLRLGLLMKNRDSNHYEWLSFYLGKMLLYTYSVKAEKWPLLPPEQVSQKLIQRSCTSLGVEVIKFYISIIDRGETPILTRLAAQSFETFVQVISNLDTFCRLTSILPREKLSTAILNRMMQYVDFLSFILSEYFLDQAPKITPSPTGEIGLWTLENGSAYQLRARTPQYPQQIVLITKEQFSLLWNKQAPLNFYNDLRPFGPLHLGLSEFVDHIPHKAAWEEVEKQIVLLFSHRMLNESNSPVILRERVWDLIQAKPVVGFFETPNEPFWNLLGFEKLQDLESVSIEELISRIDSLSRNFASNIPQGIAIQNMGNTQRWYSLRIRSLLILQYLLLQLGHHNQILGVPLIQISDLFSYMQQHTLERPKEILDGLLPEIIETYKTIFEKNFPRIIPYSKFYNNLDKLTIVELSWTPYMKSDFLTVSYVLCPSLQPINKPAIILPNNDQSIAKMELRNDTLHGESISKGGTYGYNNIRVVTNEQTINEAKAIINRTIFPSRTPILDQVYQLIGNEFMILFGNNGHGWANLEHSNPINDVYVDWIIRQMHKPN